MNAVVLVPLVGNIAKHLVAVQATFHPKMDLSSGIAIGSGFQTGLFVMPALVWTTVLLGGSMTLLFNSYELAGLIGAVLIAVLISVTGESNWLESLQLLVLYLMLGSAFYFVP